MRSIVHSLLAHPELSFPDPAFPPDQTLIVATGKAASIMLTSFITQFPRYRNSKKMVVTPEGYPVNPLNELTKTEIYISTHPFISQRSIDAGKAVVNAVASSNITHIVALVSGGSSAALALPKQKKDREFMNRLVTSGRDIVDINRIRINHSTIKGGKLADRFPDKYFFTAVMSDIPAPNGYKMVGSMPFWSKQHAHASIYEIMSSATLALLIQNHLNAQGVRVIYTNPFFMDSHASLVKTVIQYSRILQPKEAVIITGESSLKVTTTGGLGGRMTHLIASLIGNINSDISVEAYASDGIDGTGPFAGAILPFGGIPALSSDKQTESLAQYNTGTLLSSLGLTIENGATGININDAVVVIRK